MTDRPILFSAAMVRALLDGRKTQTRRALSRQWSVLGESWRSAKSPWAGLLFDRAVPRQRSTLAIFVIGENSWPDPHLDVPFLHPDDAADGRSWEDEEIWYRVRPPFEVGDRLWVREAWQTTNDLDDVKPSKMLPAITSVLYKADGHVINVPRRTVAWTKTRPGMFMPRWASRLTLTVTDVRVERLQGISTADAEAEGVERNGKSFVGAYACLWDAINGPGAWDANPWVVAVSFDVRKGNIDA